MFKLSRAQGERTPVAQAVPAQPAGTHKGSNDKPAAGAAVARPPDRASRWNLSYKGAQRALFSARRALLAPALAPMAKGALRANKQHEQHDDGSHHQLQGFTTRTASFVRPTSGCGLGLEVRRLCPSAPLGVR